MKLSTSLTDGLSESQLQAAVTQYGRNVPSKAPTQWPRKVFWYLYGGFGSLLFSGSILVFLAWKPWGEPDPQTSNLALAIVLALVWVIQALFNAWQDFSTSRVMASIKSMLPEDCLVVRNGVQRSVQAPDVVPGDLILINAGMKLCADVRFIEMSPDTKFDRSILTGESAPIATTLTSTDDNYLETKCIGLQGTHCVSGSCRAIVVSTGDATVFGRIALLTNKPDNRRTPLQKEVLRFVLIICSLAAFFIVVVLIIWGSYLRPDHRNYLDVAALVVSCVSVGIAFVPEGLPIALTASMTIVANIMRRESVLCKSLKTVETLGSVTVICSDKTGTLTRNKMTVTNCTTGTTALDTAKAVEDIANDDSSRKRALADIRTICALCNAGEFDAATSSKPLQEQRIIGDATDQAVLRFAAMLGPVEAERAAWLKQFEIPFNSKNKFMIRVLTSAAQADSSVDSPDRFVAIKGAPDVLLPRCSKMLQEDGTIGELDDSLTSKLAEIKDEWSSAGKRVILLARKDAPIDAAFEWNEEQVLEYMTGNLTLIGLLAIEDPPRDEIPDVVSTLRTAGIRVFMVTGDFKLTAVAIARACGIVTGTGRIADVTALASSRRSSLDAMDAPGEHTTDVKLNPTDQAIVLSGPELAQLDDDQWEELCKYEEIVFARTTPEQKLRIVNELQKHENIVAMTGDGVNDAPSLKAADVGVAIGGGSDIAIEAADMVLLDSFSAIVQAVLYGRVVFDNLKKTIIYLLPAGTFSEFWPVLTNVIFGLPQILSSFLMIMICCLTDCGAAMTLALEKPEADVLLRKPRNQKHDRLVNWRLLFYAYGVIGMIECVTSFTMAYWYAQRRGVPFSTLWFSYGDYGNLDPDFVAQVLDESSSIYFANLVIMQWFNLLAIRTRRLSIFQHPPFFNKQTQNLAILPAVAFAFTMIFVFCYVPPIQSAINSTQIPVENFFLPLAFGMALLIFDETRKWWVRRCPDGWLAKIAW